MKKAFIFDVDGTLLDSEPYQTIARKQLYLKLGMPVSSEDEIVTGMSKQQYWGLFKQSYGLSQSLDELISAEVDAEICLLREHRVAPSTGLRQLLEHLHGRGVKIGIASASNRRYVDAVLEHLGVAEYFTAFCCGDDEVAPKPSPEPYLLACKKLGVKPEEAVGVEDSRTGSMAVAAAGMFCIGYRETELAKKADLSACDLVVNDMTEILEWFKTEN